MTHNILSAISPYTSHTLLTLTKDYNAFFFSTNRASLVVMALVVVVVFVVAWVPLTKTMVTMVTKEH